MAPLPELITVDIFGTVLDWRNGLESACRAAGRALQPGEFEAIVDLQGELERREFATYAEITARSLREIPGLDRATASRIGAEVGRWPLYGDSPDALRALMRRAPVVAMTNSDTAHGEQIRQQLGFRLDDWLCAEEARVYKPDPRFWAILAARRGIRPGRGWWHVSAYADYDLGVAERLGLTTVLVRRPGGRPGAASHAVGDLAELARLLS